MKIAIDSGKRSHILAAAERGLVAFKRDHPEVSYLPINDSLLLSRLPASVDGYFSPTPSDRRLAELQATGVPAVAMYGGHGGVLRVHPDFATVGQMAGRHLMDRYFKHFGFFTADIHASYHWEVYQSYRDTLARSGFECEVFDLADRPEAMSATDTSARLGALQRWLCEQPKPFALAVSAEDYEFEPMYACKLGDLCIPHDVAVIQIGGNTLFSPFADPPHTTADLNYPAVAYEALSWLIKLIQGKVEPGLTDVAVAPRQIIERRSTNMYDIADGDVRRAVQYIHEHAARGVRVDELAEAVLLSRSSLERKMRDHLGITPAKLIRRLRLNRAIDAIQSSKESISQIAMRFGYTNASQFSRDVKSLTGRTATELRRNGPA